MTVMSHWCVTKSACLMAAIFFALAQTAVADEFQNLKCGVDVPKAMIGKRSTNGRVMELEKRYAAIGLKGLGGDEIADGLSSVNWLICGSEYIELIDSRGLVRDVLAFPPHSKEAPAFSGICQAKGKDLPDVIVAVLDATGAGELLPVKTAWKLDRPRAKFVAIAGEGVRCPRSGIITADGGR